MGHYWVMKWREFISSNAPLYLCVLDQPHSEPWAPGEFWIENCGEPEKGTFYIDVNPGELAKPIHQIYEQTSKGKLIRGRPPHARYSAKMVPHLVPLPKSFLEITKKINEGQFIEFRLNDKGVLLIPRTRRATVLQFLGFNIGD